MDAEYIIQFDDYKAAHRLWLLHRPWAMFCHLFVMWILPGVVVCANCWSAWLWIQQRNDILGVAYGITIALTWLCLILILRYRKRLRRRYQELAGGGAAPRMRISVNDAHIAVTAAGKSETRFAWSAIQRFLEDEHGGVLVAGKTLITVPRRAFEEPQWSELRGLAAKVARAG